tara:strand:- start:50059 stop:51570 length:1512 start_codon:yes stop_codon:yes gene_type:complete
MNKHIIAAGDKTTVETAHELLWVGGNAFDAAVGAMFTAMVSEPALTSAGGGGHFMADPESGTPILFDFFVDMPSGELERVNIDFFSIDIDFGDSTQEFHIGKGAVAVPGTVAGLLHVQKSLGCLSLMEVLKPAIREAKEGVVLSDVQAYMLTILEPIMMHEENSRKIYAPEGKLLGEGETIIMPEFSDFLDALAHEGQDLMYKGEVAKLLVEWSREGGLLTMEDLKNYSVVEREPLETKFYDYSVYLNPPPALSGILIDATLSLLSRCKKGITLAEIVQALDITNILRMETLAGSLDKGVKYLSKQAFFKKYVETFAKRSPKSHSRGATTHISILDKNGNAASVTTTNGEGCGSVLSHVGFMPNNMLGEEDLNPEGFHMNPPRTRLASMMSPTIVVKEKRPVLLTGSAGSNRIRSVIVQLIIHVLCEEMDIELATKHPRVHIEGDVLHAEPGLGEDVLSSFEQEYQINRWERQNVFFGGANSVTHEKGAGDERRGGYSVIIED